MFWGLYRASQSSSPLYNYKAPGKGFLQHWLGEAPQQGDLEGHDGYNAEATSVHLFDEPCWAALSELFQQHPSSQHRLAAVRFSPAEGLILQRHPQTTLLVTPSLARCAESASSRTVSSSLGRGGVKSSNTRWGLLNDSILKPLPSSG